jgi:23S rRNA (guanine2535-N1)-methyltransferase
MQYKHAKEQLDYSDFSSGRVFYSLPGHPAFPVRLASEIFQRCLAQRERIYQVSTPCTLYDPCCGAAYHLSVLAYLHRQHIRQVIASDIDERALALAERNLSLLHPEGLDRRIHELSELVEKYGKESHREAVRSAAVLKERLSTFPEKPPLETRAFQASATDRNEISKQIEPKSVDLLFTDVPYGQHSQWRASDPNYLSNPLTSMLDAIFDRLSSASIVAVASDKGQKATHERLQRVEHLQVGKRRVVILRPT